MSKEKEAFSKVVEEALNKTIEANKVFLNESTKFFSQLGKRDATSNLNIFRGEALSNAFSQYMKLSLDHFNNLVDLGVNFIRNVNNSNTADTPPPPGAADAGQPSFVLEKEVAAGDQVSFQFLLDNVKQDTVTCQLVHTGFTGAAGDSADHFNIVFTPLVFELPSGESRSIDITVHVAAGTTPGFYASRVQVKGFEPAYFSIQLIVIESTNQPKADGRKKDKPAGK